MAGVFKRASSLKSRRSNRRDAHLRRARRQDTSVVLLYVRYGVPRSLCKECGEGRGRAS